MAEWEESKKPRMRTSSDVVSRLLWDESLKKSDFIVGYLDRFLGVVEKPFIALDWSDPAIVDNSTLALPKHRIQYFKYKCRKVWDKDIRLDLVFGSTGHSQSIYDVMKEIDKLEAYAFPEFDESCFFNHKSIQQYQMPKDRPNFFIAARIINEFTLDELQNVANDVKINDSTLSECCMNSSEYHLTLATLQLNGSDDILDACMALNDLQMRSITCPVIELEGLNVFHRRVLYAQVTHNEELLRLRQQLMDSLNEWDLKIMDRDIFIPHVTIAKTSRPVARVRRSRFINESLYSNHMHKNFGTEKVNKLYLCNMGKARLVDGFYMYISDVDLSSSSEIDYSDYSVVTN